MSKPSFSIPKNEITEALVSFKRTFRSRGIFSAIINLLMLAPTLYMLQVYDRVLQSRNEITLLMLSLILLGSFAFLSALDFVRSFVLIRVGARLDMRLNKRVYTAAFEQSLKKGGGNAGQALANQLGHVIRPAGGWAGFCLGEHFRNARGCNFSESRGLPFG